MVIKQAPIDLAKEIDLIEAAYQLIPAKVQKEVLAKAQELSSGTVTKATLRALDHPYAKRHGKMLLPVFPINKQSGKFAASWKPRKRGKALTVENGTKYAQFVNDGTRKMFGRDIATALQDFADSEAERLANQVADHFNQR